MSPTPDVELRERVRRIPGIERLLPALEGLPPAYLVGGAVRDLLRGADAVDVDIAVEGDARSVARALAERLSAEVREHERFGTATVRAGDLGFDLATTRTEVYDEPGALPRVAAASLDEDLARRDFAINAMAVGLTGDDLGHLYDPCGGLSDLNDGVVRVLHDRSFLDDPTRLLRAVRYEVRLGFRMNSATESLARAAVVDGALRTVSGARVRDELLDLLGESQAPAGVRRMHDLGLDLALHPALDSDPDLVASASLGAAAIGADPALAALAALCAAAPAELDLWLADLHLPAAQRDSVARAARVGPRLARELRAGEHQPSQLRSLLGREPVLSLALAMAMGAPSEPILRWVTELRSVRLEISGDDLLAAGVPEGPAVGRALDETLSRKLDGLVSGRDEELETALAVAREAAR
ncbi:MAG: CCA tRNA nucleotidyltransferase [Thermoleophilaceae bacterium]|nr:CCA tRNA nucleotidyltransferase [Thermoleophilaceae bacterium]